MLNILYQFLTLITSAGLLPFFYFKKNKRKNLSQRYGKWDLTEGEYVWLHAASFGEVNALSPVIKFLKDKYPAEKFLISTMSETGHLKAQEFTPYAYLLPFDNGIWLSRAIGKSRIKALIITETEIWPALINFAAKRSIPLYQINARISDYTFPVYKKLKLFIKPLLNKFSKISVISRESGDRFLELGVAAERIEINGYSKYDIKPTVNSASEAEALKLKYFKDDIPLLTLGSIRPDEEKVWFSAIKKARDNGLSFNLIVAPRHKEKFDFFAEKLKGYNIDFERYSELSGKPSTHHSILLDTMGKLQEAYSFSSLAFIGATLVDIGGHNPLEPACYDCAVCVGPYYNNVRDIVESLKENKGILFVGSQDDAYHLIEKLSVKSEVIKEKAANAHKFWKENYGASSKIVKTINF